MKKLIICSILFLVLAVSVYAEFSGDVYVAGVSRYLWRGQLLEKGPCLQPGLDLNYGPFSLGLWSNHFGSSVFAELDYTLTYTHSLSEIVEMNLGYTYYSFPDPEYLDSHEAFVGASFDVFLTPSMTVYYDFDDGDGMYLEGGASFPFKLGVDFSLDGALGFNAGQWGYDSSLTVFGLGLSTVIAAGPIEITPLVFYQLPLDDQYEADGYASLSAAYNF